MTSPIPLWEDLTVKEKMNKERRWNRMANAVNEALGLTEKEVVEEDVTPTFDVRISVTDSTDAVQGAMVDIDGITKTTGRAGGCNFTDLTPGEKTVTVTKEGFVEKIETITVSENAIFTIVLTPESS